MSALLDLVSPAVKTGHVTLPVFRKEIETPPEKPALSCIFYSGTGFVPMVSDGLGPNNVGTEKEGKNPAGPEALSSLKDVLAVGEYKHPVHGWNLDVTKQKLAKLCAAFAKMKAAGVKVPIYADHNPGAATTLGYARDIFMGGPEAIKKYPELAKLPAEQAPLDPNRLYAIHDWASPEAMKMGHGVGQVSVMIDKKMKDGTGKSYGEAVRHIAVTPEPIVPGQGKFTQLAASLLNDSKTALYAFDKKDGDDMEDDDDEDDKPNAKKYSGMKAKAESAAEKAIKSGDHESHIEAGMCHYAASQCAPSDEEGKAHRDLAAKHLREAAYAVQKSPTSDAEEKAQAIHQKSQATAQKHGKYFDRLAAVASPAVLALSRG